jgi:uncharacterized protein (DUF1800 family)
VCRGIRCRQQHRSATIRQRNGDRGGDGGLADATLAHDHHQAVITGREFFDDGGERRNRRQLDTLRARLRTSWFLTRFAQEGAHQRQTHDVEGPHGHIDTP